MHLSGWAQHARWLLWQAELNEATDSTLTDLLAIRLVWEEALLAHTPSINTAWQEVLDQHAKPVEPSQDQVVDCILQEALERAHQRKLGSVLKGTSKSKSKPTLQAAFCIDVRSETFRRALEAQSLKIETNGFAGFFLAYLSPTQHTGPTWLIHTCRCS